MSQIPAPSYKDTYRIKTRPQIQDDLTSILTVITPVKTLFTNKVISQEPGVRTWVYLEVGDTMQTVTDLEESGASQAEMGVKTRCLPAPEAPSVGAPPGPQTPPLKS